MVCVCVKSMDSHPGPNGRAIIFYFLILHSYTHIHTQTEVESVFTETQRISFMYINDELIVKLD